jgi:hypothetical protein
MKPYLEIKQKYIQVKRDVFFVVKILIFCLPMLQCKKDGCLYSTGGQTKRLLADGHFVSIQVWGIFNVELVQDTICFVEGIGGENVIDHVGAEIKDDTLSLYNYNNCFWLRDYKKVHLRLHIKGLKSIDVHETSLIYSTDSITDNFSIVILCDMAESDLVLNSNTFRFLGYTLSGGVYKFRGKSESINISGYYTSVIDASALESSSVVVKNHGIGDYKVWAKDQLRIEIHNRGNIYVKGNPEIVFDSLTSTGKILPLN